MLSRGYRLQFAMKPSEFREGGYSVQSVFSRKSRSLSKYEISSLLEKGAII